MPCPSWKETGSEHVITVEWKSAEVSQAHGAWRPSRALGSGTEVRVFLEEVSSELHLGK